MRCEHIISVRLAADPSLFEVNNVDLLVADKSLGGLRVNGEELDIRIPHSRHRAKRMPWFPWWSNTPDYARRLE